MQQEKKGKFERKYLAYVVAYSHDERGIFTGCSIQELTNEEIATIYIMYCRDLETSEEIIFQKDEIIRAIEIYGENLFSKKDDVFLPNQIRKLEIALGYAKIKNRNLVNSGDYITEAVKKAIEQLDDKKEKGNQLIRR